MPNLEFTKKEKNKIQILEQEIDTEKFDDKGLPADTHMVTYEIDGKTLSDTVRAYTKVDIFDAYYDKLKGVGIVTKIESGYGNVRPNLYGKIKNEE